MFINFNLLENLEQRICIHYVIWSIIHSDLPYLTLCLPRFLRKDNSVTMKIWVINMRCQKHLLKNSTIRAELPVIVSLSDFAFFSFFLFFELSYPIPTIANSDVLISKRGFCVRLPIKNMENFFFNFKSLQVMNMEKLNKLIALINC